jgi:hypothetical protein
LKNHVNPLSFESNNHILQNILAKLGGGRVGGNQPPSPSLNPWVTARFRPLNMHVHVHDIPKNNLNLLPKYDGEQAHSVEERILSFQDFTKNIFMENNDVLMRIFVQILERDVHKWFIELHAASINIYHSLESAFMKQWGERETIYIT